MHPRVLAERNAAAVERTKNAMGALATNLGVEAPAFGVKAGNLGPDVTQLLDRETIAEYLERLAFATAPKQTARPTAEAAALPATGKRP